MRDIHRQQGFVQLPALAAIGSLLIAIGSWLASAWTAATSALITYSTLRFAVMVIIATVWLTAFTAVVLAIDALLPTAAVTTASASLRSNNLFAAYFLPWFSYLRPACLTACIGAISATWVAAKLWQVYWVILDIRRT